MVQEILYYKLEEINLNNGRLYRVKKGSKLHVICNSTLINKNIRFFCNIPSNLSQIINKFKFERDKFYEYSWVSTPGTHSNDFFDKYIEIEFLIAGSFEFYFVIVSGSYDNNEYLNIKYANGGCDILVEPELRYSNGTLVDLNSLQMQTVLPKLLGSLDEWEDRLRVTKESGYNMLHFAPVEELSKQSNSSYSIRDHFKLNDIASVNEKYTLNDLETLILKLYKEWNMFAICDLVYNHMSNDSPFLNKCPNAAYNLVNSKFLRPAYLLDRMLHYLSKDIEAGKYISIGIKSEFLEYHNLEQIRDLIKTDLLPLYRFEEFYCLNIDETINKIHNILSTINGTQELSNMKNDDDCLWSKLVIIQDEQYRRLKCTVDFEVVKQIIVNELKPLNMNDNAIIERFRNHLQNLNDTKKSIVYSWLENAIENVLLNAKYHFFAEDGPKYKFVSVSDTPLVPTYFYCPFNDSNMEQEELYAFDDDKGRFLMAHNGWVMNHDPLVNFCNPDSLVYIKRELIAWGDSVKLRFGNKPSDCPELWNYMADYTRNAARIFHGVRLDNCHNTPLHVAQYLLDIARDVRPDLYVIAELFTNNASTDNIFVSKLGITSLIRESMNAWNAREFSRLQHRFGGDPVGSLMHPIQRPLKESVAHAVFFDVTHDNKSLIGAHTVYDALSRSALILMCGCAYGSTRGYDELVPHEIHVVKETRLYARWKPDNLNKVKKLSDNEKFIDLDSSFICAKRAFNNLHYEMATKGYNEIYVDALDDEVIAVTRSNPKTHQSIVLVSRTAFYHQNTQSTIKQFYVPLKLKNILFEAKLVQEKYGTEYEFKKDEFYINGLENFKLEFNENLNLESLNKSFFISNIKIDENETVIYFKDLPPGSVIAFSCGISDKLTEAIQNLRSKILTSCVTDDGSSILSRIVDRLSFDELNILLFRSAEEEIDEQIFSSVYNIPNYGSLLFCGLQGFMNVLEKLRLKNDLGHPIFENLRQGNWMMEYIVRRLKSSCGGHNSRQALNDLANWLDNIFNLVYQIPRYLIPAYFDVIMTSLYTRVLTHCFSLMNNDSLTIKRFVSNGSSLIHSLALVSIQLVGISKSAKLPNTLVNSSLTNENILSIAAGLPHFSHGIMRNWGRDTFISLKGLLLLTNRFEDAKNLILTNGSCLRHGLIPNLLGEGICARYNARDAIWWWLKGIKDYTECVPDGYKILDEEVYRLYPTDDSPYPPHSIPEDAPKQKISFIIQEALTVHVNGLRFIERNAGPSIDENMRDEGFHNNIAVNLTTGFVYGGNRYNCGTWMDKMGSSTKAWNKGIPATPRDGSAVELVGLNRSILDWLIKMNEIGHYPYDGVILDDLHRISQNLKIYTWKEWAARIDKNFEKYFWIDYSSTESNLINKRDIYKDTLGSSLAWTDYQLRPNFLIALCLAPQMINPDNARKALEQCKQFLLNSPNSIGIKTLDQSDYNYCGTYDNSNDSEDPRIAHGYNYHNGPEWLWPIGYYLRCVMQYSNKEHDHDSIVAYVQGYLAKYYDCIRSTDWKSLPELTNENGQDCIYSCPSQAWSIASLLEAYYDFINY